MVEMPPNVGVPVARKKLSIGTPTFGGISTMMKTPAAKSSPAKKVAAAATPKKTPVSAKKKSGSPKKTPKSAKKSPKKTPLKAKPSQKAETPNLEGIADLMKTPAAKKSPSKKVSPRKTPAKK